MMYDVTREVIKEHNPILIIGGSASWKINAFTKSLKINLINH